MRQDSTRSQIVPLVLITLLIVGVCAFYLYNKFSNQDKTYNQMEEQTERLYQGPVPEGYDEDYFRKTGITREMGDTDGES